VVHRHVPCKTRHEGSLIGERRIVKVTDPEIYLYSYFGVANHTIHRTDHYTKATLAWTLTVRVTVKKDESSDLCRQVWICDVHVSNPGEPRWGHNLQSFTPIRQRACGLDDKTLYI
jgi:hypothetical protein